MKPTMGIIVALAVAIGFFCCCSADVASADGSPVIDYDSGSKTISVTGSGDMSDYSTDNNLATLYPDAETITIGDGITGIGSYAVYGSAHLLTINIGKDVTSIGDGAFAHCTKVTAINYDVASCTTSTSSHIFTVTGSQGSGIALTFGNDVVTVSVNLFHESLLSDMANLRSVTYGTSMTAIGSELAGSGIYSVNIPDNITKIGNGAFSQCSSLSTVTIGKGVTSIGDSAFSFCHSLGSIVIPEGVTSVGENCFQNDENLATVTLPSTLTGIGATIFNGCGNLSTVNGSLAAVGDGMFLNCSKITSVTLSDNVTRIGSSAFASSGITGIIIPDSVTSIGGNAFENCAGLKTIKVGKGVSSLGENVFSGCRNVTEITINVASDEDSLWGYGSNFNNLGADGNGVTLTLGDDAKLVPIFPSSAKIVSVTFGKNITKMPFKPAFKDNTYLKDVVFNATNCSDVGQYTGTFANCTDLNVTIGDSVQRIPAYLFDKGVDKAPTIISLKVSKNVSDIGTKAFGSIKFTDKEGNSLNADAKDLAGKTFAGDGKTLSVVSSGSKEAEGADITITLLAVLSAAIIIAVVVAVTYRKLQ